MVQPLEPIEKYFHSPTSSDDEDSEFPTFLGKRKHQKTNQHSTTVHFYDDVELVPKKQRLIGHSGSRDTGSQRLVVQYTSPPFSKACSVVWCL